jgi:hypothetical protein
MGGVSPQTQADEVKLLASDGVANDYFGHSVSLSSDKVVIGAYGDDSAGGERSGSAYVYQFDGTSWEETRLVASDREAEDYFGFSVSVDGQLIAVGATLDNDQGEFAGSVYVYQHDGSNWIETKILASDGEAYDNFGWDVVLQEQTLVVGARWDNDNGTSSGSVYVYQFDGVEWIETKLLASDGATFDEFGSSVAIWEDLLVVGAPGDSDYGSASGSAYLFRFTGTNWIEVAKFHASDAASSDEFGSSVSISEGVIVVGSYDDNNENGIDAGSAYVFRNQGLAWIEEAKLIASEGSEDDYFGNTVSVDHDTIVVGTRYDDQNGYNAGCAYVYRYDGEHWSETKLVASDGDEYDQFGFSTALKNNTLVVGSYWDDESGSASGSAYVLDIGLNACPDPSGDGVVDVNDILIVVDRWGQNDPVADLNDDGVVSVLDLLLLIDNWGPCE